MKKGLLLAAVVFISACGGGGDSGTPPPPPPPATVTTSYVQLRVEMLSTSDWTTLSLPPAVLASRLTQATGPLERWGATAERLWLDAQNGLSAPLPQQILEAELALSPAQLANGLPLLLEKGVAGGVTLRVWVRLADGQYQLLNETVHTGVVPGNTTSNPKLVDLQAAVQDLPQQQKQAARIQRQALAFYYPWYVPADWDLTIFIDEPVQRYSTDSSTDVSRVVDQAINAGLTGFISSWWGPEDASNSRFQILLDAIGQRDFKATLYFETLRQGVAMEDAAIIDELVYALQQYGDHPAFLRHDNKPVLFIWASGRVTAERWKTILAAVRQQAGPALFIGMGCDTLDLDVFDGVHDYTVNAPTDLPRYQRLCGNKTRHHFLLSPSGGRKLWAATAMPGYDDRALTQRAEHLLIPRDSGAYYRHTLQAALDSQPDWLLVTSWNEWGENTHIENSVVYGDLYERLTREYTAPWLANR